MQDLLDTTGMVTALCLFLITNNSDLEKLDKTMLPGWC